MTLQELFSHLARVDLSVPYPCFAVFGKNHAEYQNESVSLQLLGDILGEVGQNEIRARTFDTQQ
jgi:hypothetical protein